MPTQAPRSILYIEDNEGQGRLLQKRLARAGFDVELVLTGEEGIKLLLEKQYDLILLDYELPGMTGLQVLGQMHPSEHHAPVILLTSGGDERVALHALEMGAADYAVKDSDQVYIELLPAIMQAAFTRVRLARENLKQQQALAEYAALLQGSEERLNLAIAGSQIGVWDWNIQTGSLYWSSELRDMFELKSDEEPDYDKWLAHAHPDDRTQVEQAIQDYLQERTPNYQVIYRERNRLSKHPEDWRWVLCRGTVLRDSAGIAFRMLGICMDITHQKRLEEQLEIEKRRAEEANIAKTDFLATMSHEIRTPMNAVLGLAGLLAQTSLGTKQQEIVDTLKSSAEVLLSLINNLLDISRIESGQIEIEHIPFSVSELVEDLRAMLESSIEQKGLKLKIVDKTGGQTVTVDKTRLQQILINLCGNAVKFTDAGEIRIEANIIPQADSKNLLQIAVADTGIGIPKAIQANIFNKFVQADQTITRRFGGSGLGLAISKSLAEMMGGDITVTSEEGKGSTFIFSAVIDTEKALPLKQRRQEMSVPPIEEQNGKYILLAEDYAPNVLVATLLLDSLGHRYEVASSGHEAIEKVQQTIRGFDMILMDVQMHGMDGLEATRQIRQWELKNRRPRCPIIGLTAHALAGDREKCLGAGMDDYMTKPIQPDIFAQKLTKLKTA